MIFDRKSISLDILPATLFLRLLTSGFFVLTAFIKQTNDIAINIVSTKKIYKARKLLCTEFKKLYF